MPHWYISKAPYDGVDGINLAKTLDESQSTHCGKTLTSDICGIRLQRTIRIDPGTLGTPSLINIDEKDVKARDAYSMHLKSVCGSTLKHAHNYSNNQY